MTETNDATLLSMDEAIEWLKTTRPTFYRWLRSGRIKGMKVGRQWRFYADDLERFLKGEGPRVDLPIDIRPLIAALHREIQKVNKQSALLEDLESDDAERVCELILELSQCHHASHLHLETLISDQDEACAVLRLRLGGVLKPVLEFDRRLLSPLLSQFKTLANCDPLQTQQAQEGRLHFESIQGNTQFRAHFLPSLNGETMTLTALQAQQVFSLEKLKLAQTVNQSLMQALKKGWGMVLTSGPTGSGKTTTLYAALHEMASPQIKSISIEDPVEHLHPWVVPVALDSQSGETMSSKIKEVLQSDPDLILIGELRDSESLQLSLRLALTGHLVLSQLHAQSALHALMRLCEVSGSAYTVTEAVSIVLNQRLIRQLCPACRQQHKLSADDKIRFEALQKLCGINWKELTQIPTAVGCEACGQTGYKGQIQITEALTISSELSRLLHQNASFDAIQDHLSQRGFKSFLHDGLDKVKAGMSTLDELLRVAGIN